MKTRLLATGSPEELSREFWGRTTVVQLRDVTLEMIDAVRSVSGVIGLKRCENKLLVDVVEPTTSNPAIVKALVSSGAEVEYVSELKRTLEDVYVKLLGGQQ